jgi:uncharacterized Tic20 family protein
LQQPLFYVAFIGKWLYNKPITTGGFEMGEIIAWASLIALVLAPFTSIIYLCLSWSRFKETVPFTPEHSKKKVRLIIAAVLAAIFVGTYIAIMAIFGVKVFFAGLLA